MQEPVLQQFPALICASGSSDTEGPSKEAMEALMQVEFSCCAVLRCVECVLFCQLPCCLNDHDLADLARAASSLHANFGCTRRYAQSGSVRDAGPHSVTLPAAYTHSIVAALTGMQVEHCQSMIACCLEIVH